MRALKIVIAGHVDHGKSTLIGRLLYDTKSLPPGKMEELDAVSRRRGVPLEWSFVLDALQSERDQAVTIETARVWFSWKGRRYVIIDAPGHQEFIRNMLSGASEADAAVLVVDAIEGVSEQTKRHGQLLLMLGVQQVAVALNKMDLVDYRSDVYDKVAGDTKVLVANLGLRPSAIIPISARNGENLALRSGNMPWYRGKTLVEALAEFDPAVALTGLPLRMRVQDVYRQDGSRVAVGRIESGSLAVGDALSLLPMGSQATVRSIERWNGSAERQAVAGESIGLTFQEPVFASRGDLICHATQSPTVGYSFRALCFWLDELPPQQGEQMMVQFGPTTSRAIVTAIENVTDSSSLKRAETEEIPRYAMVQLRLRSASLLALDEYAEMPTASRFVLMRGRDVVGSGAVNGVAGTYASINSFETGHLVTADQRANRNGHRGAVIWLTGLSGAGKSTLAMAVERRLFAMGASIYVLDGDNIRSGLNSDLTFSAGDRAENIRRIGEVARLFADAGMVVVAAFISPMGRDRQIARLACGKIFHEVYVRASLEICERRDAKGLYKLARAGQITDFTGISAPYEAPASPELVVDTEQNSIEDCVEQLVDFAQCAAGLQNRY